MDRAEWDEGRWGPPPPADPVRRAAERPAALWVAALLMVASEVAGVLVYSRSGPVVGAASVAIAAGFAWGLLEGRVWPRRLVSLGAALTLALPPLIWSVAPPAFRLELLIRALGAALTLAALWSAPSRAYFHARLRERLG